MSEPPKKSDSQPQLGLPTVQQERELDSEALKKALELELKSLPRDKREVVVQLALSHRENYSGPIPSPRHFEHYERVLPGAGNRILVMEEERHAVEVQERREILAAAQREQDHRQRNENRNLNHLMNYSWVGLGLGFLAFMALVSGAFYSMYLGSPAGAAVFLAAAATSVIATFVNGKLPGFRAKEVPEEKPPSETPPKPSQPQLPPSKGKGGKRQNR